MKTRKEVSQHTAGPWIKTLMHEATRTPEQVAKFAGPNAGYALRAINSHEELLEALINCVLDLKREYLTPDKDGYTLAPDSVYLEKVRLYEKAIAKAEGK